MLLVYLVLAGEYESWFMPVAVLLAVPLSLLGPVVALTGLGIANNLYTQIGLVLLIALSVKNAILIVEVSRARRVFHGKRLAARGGAASVESHDLVAFILSVVPLVFATGVSASGAQVYWHRGVQWHAGSSTACRAVRAVVFVVVRCFEEWRAARWGKAAEAALARRRSMRRDGTLV